MRYGNSDFKANVTYRVSYDEDRKGCLVYGEWMSLRKFKANFLLYVPVIQERLTKLGLIVEGKPVSFKKFKEMLDSVPFGRRANNLRIHFLGNPKENYFGFYPSIRDTKVEEVKACYRMYVGLVEGEYDNLDPATMAIQWGNCGTPISYSRLRRDELGYLNPKRVAIEW